MRAAIARPESRKVLTLFLGATLVIVSACASSGTTPANQATSVTPAPSGQVDRIARTLSAAIRVEPPTIAARSPLTVGQAQFLVLALFNADLGALDENDVAHPLLAEALPQLNSPQWQVFPDGRMQTTYTLRPNIKWHDGAPLTAEDFVFSWQFFSTPQFAVVAATPFRQIERVVASDARTVDISWKVPYFDAGTLTSYNGTFPPLPRHLLQGAFERENPDSLQNLAYWTQEFVGLGPYRLDRWEPGVAIEGSAFDGYIRGRPRIDRVQVRFISDANTALSNLRSDAINMAGDGAVGVLQSIDIVKEWQGSGGGTVIFVPSQWRSIRFQFRPDLADPPGTLDPRVRKALAYGLDKKAVIDGLYGGQEVESHSFVAPGSPYGAIVDQATMKFPLDLRQSEQLMNEAGFTKRADGFYASASGRFSPELKINASAEFETERSLVASGWKAAGFDVQEAANSAALSQDPRARNEYRSMFANSTTATTDAITPNFISNGNWADGEFDRLSAMLQVTPALSERQQIMIQLMRIYGDVLPAISLRFASHPWLLRPGLSGFKIGPSETSLGWSVPTWALTSGGQR